MPLQRDKSLIHLNIERKKLCEISIKIFQGNFSLTLNSDRISTDNPTIDHIQNFEDRTELIFKSLLEEIGIQVSKERKIIQTNKYLVTSTEITIRKRKKRIAEEKLKLT